MMDRPITDALAAVPLFGSLDRGPLEQLARAPRNPGPSPPASSCCAKVKPATRCSSFSPVGSKFSARAGAGACCAPAMSSENSRCWAIDPATPVSRAIRDGEVWRIDATAFAAVLAASPALARGLVEALTRLVFESAPLGAEVPASDTVVALAALHADIPMPALVDAFRAAADAGPVCVVDRAAAGADPNDWGPRVEASERADGLVLLVAGPERDEWFEFCCREADRIVAVADVNRAAAALASTTRIDLVLCGAPRCTR